MAKENANMAARYEHEIPEGYEARIEGNKVIIEKKEDVDEKIRTRLIALVEAFGQGKYKDEMLAYLERQKEQKPAEWSEEDEKILRNVYESLYAYQCDIRGDGNPDLELLNQVEKEKQWLKSLPERFTLQPEQEVVDRTVFDRIADILRWCDLPIGCPIEDFKQSESEREHLLHIVQCVAHRYAISCKYCKEYSRGYQVGLSVPHWKPSEYTLSLVKKVAKGEMLTHMEQMAMGTLYEQLKSL